MSGARGRTPEQDLAVLRSLESMEGLVEVAPGKPETAPWTKRVPYGALIHAVYPGLLVAVTIALASDWLSQHYGAPVMLFALLFGMAFHFLHEQGRCVAGIEFASRTVLRTGVALLGARITMEQIASLGIVPVLTVIAAVATTILIGLALSRTLGQTRTFGVLSGGSVAICGVSAALAIATVLPRGPTSERDTILACVTVTALSTIAMIIYPVLVTTLHLDNAHAGVFLGGTIHDVAQVVGAGYMISPQTGDIATYVKLLRVAMLLPVVLTISIVLARSQTASGGKRTPLLPAFLVAFAVLVALNSLGLFSKPVVETITTVSRWCLITAIAALGMKTSFKELYAVGWRPVGLMVIETAWIGVLVLASVELLT